MDSFFPPLVIELHNRCEKIIQLLNSLSLPQDIAPNLSNTIQNAIKIKTDLESILNDPDFGAPELLLNQITSYKRCYESYSFIENMLLPILLRYSGKDRFFHAFLKRSLSQINYNIDVPLISAASTNYYEVYADKNPLLSSFYVPIVDDMFLLNLPDLFHEIGHLIYLHNENKMSDEFIVTLNKYISDEKKRINDQIRPFDKNFYETLEELWKDCWIKEHAANMIATYCLGPSFAWQCLRICTNTGEDVYVPAEIEIDPIDHPSFESQIQGILEILKIMGMCSEVSNLQEKWEHYKLICLFAKPTEHDHCYPDHLMKELANNVFRGCKKIGLTPYTSQKLNEDAINIPLALNESWKLFQRDPKSYLIWEEMEVKKIKFYLCEKS